jgi:hypothetical protein
MFNKRNGEAIFENLLQIPCMDIETIRIDEIYNYMIYDFTKTCNTYNKSIYTADYFYRTTCSKCDAVGMFKLHGSYKRYILFYRKFKPIHKQIEIKRIMCKSCKTTHAVLPGDITDIRWLVYKKRRVTSLYKSLLIF